MLQMLQKTIVIIPIFNQLTSLLLPNSVIVNDISMSIYTNLFCYRCDYINGFKLAVEKFPLTFFYK